MFSDADIDPFENRGRLAWWLFVAVLGAAAAYIAYSFVGMLVLGVFGYYATRPVFRRLGEVVDSDRIAAGVTVSLVVVPIVGLSLYAGFQLVQQAQGLLLESTGLVKLLQQYFGFGSLPSGQRERLLTLLQNPRGLVSQPGQSARSLLQTGGAAASAVFGTLLLLALSVVISYALLVRESGLSDALVELFGGRDSTAYAYAVAVDQDLESVFFGNLLFVLVMTVIAAVAYGATNLLAPEGVAVPMLFVLAFLTGVASLIPVVVGKVVYLPVVASLAYQTLGSGGGSGGLLFVAGALVAYVVLLDLAPQALIQPYVTGRQLDMLLLMFGYILGPILLGWYGFFLLPIVFIVMLEAVRIVLPELVHGRPLTQGVDLAEDVGTNPRDQDDVPTE
ncbi:AI-2E family transporter [Halobium salinum]|uniref:AI-2E family transporter n=1 Tax=Halobium salinum TaxID=1364940 RepID=A0ABD5P7B0_9EURY|nr:AI-2E family transporter [Halobium salinum]